MMHTASEFSTAELAPTASRPAPPGRALSRAVALATASGTAYGAWAVFANRAHGAAIALRAGAAQCALSFVSTFVMVVLLERLFALGRTPTRGFWLASAGTTAASATLMATTHALAGTPRILVTIAPLVAIAATVYTTYAWGLRRAASR